MSSIKNKNISKWVLVLLGIICLTPIIGGITGGILIILGLLVYKNKVLILIGIGGVAVTIVLYSYLIYYSSHRGPFDEGRVVVAQREMNDLIKDIELYKLNYGQYPQDLQTLKHNDSNIKITDPIQDVNPDQPPYYYYKIVNERYLLFSKGFDGLPFTSDDILPLMIGTNPNKIGIIIPK